LQKLAAFFGFNAELTAIEEPKEEAPKEEKKELTELEKAQALLEAAGFEISEKAEQVSEEQPEEEQPQEEQVAPVEVADLVPDPVATMAAQIEKLQNQLKDLQFANAGKSTAQAKETKTETNTMGKQKFAQSSALAELIKS
jgi:hypothetical protein